MSSNNINVSDNTFLTVVSYVVVLGVYCGVGVGFTGDETVIVPPSISCVNNPPDISKAGVLLYEKYLTVPVVYVGNCWLLGYVLSNCTPTCSVNDAEGNVSNMISESLDIVGLTSAVLDHLTLDRPSHSSGTDCPLISFNSPNNVIVAVPGDVSSYTYIAMILDLSSSR